MWKQLPLLVTLSLLANFALGDTLCNINNGGCGANANCYNGYNGPSSVQCVCVNGFYMTTSGCVAVNACATNNGGCDAHATCSTTLGTYSVTCLCNSPYTGNGYYCAPPPVNLCATANGGCDAHAACYGGVGGGAVTCVCNSGYYSVGSACVAVNACATNNGGCDAHATCSTTLATYTVSCACIAGYTGDGYYCALPVTGAGGAPGGEAVAATGLLIRVRTGDCRGAGTCNSGQYDGDQPSMNKYIVPCDVEGTGLNCGNPNPTSVNTFMLEVNNHLFAGPFQAPQSISHIDFDEDTASALGVSTDTAAIIDGYIWGDRNTDLNLLASADDDFRVMVDFNNDGSFTSDEWGGAVFSGAGVCTLTQGHFGAPGCRRLHGGYYNGPSLRQFHLAAIPNADVGNVHSGYNFGPYIVPAGRFFAHAADCPVCHCSAGFFIATDCSATSNAVCKPCCDPTQCTGAEQADPHPNCPGSWEGCPTPPNNYFDWRYPSPTCDSLSVDYPTDLPDGQSNDCNVRIRTPSGPITLNFHNNVGCWSGHHTFDFHLHPNFPADADTTGYSVEWVQVAGSNCHWTGSLQCGATAPPSPPDQPSNNWQYPAPTCTDLTVTYPSGLEGQTNDVNVHVLLSDGTIVGINFHQATDFTGETHFDILGKLGLPAGTPYTIIWVQVGGTNYHWQGSVACTA